MPHPSEDVGEAKLRPWPFRWKKSPIQRRLIAQFERQGFTAVEAAMLAQLIPRIDFDDLLVTSRETGAILEREPATLLDWKRGGKIFAIVDKKGKKISSMRAFLRAEIYYVKELMRAYPPGNAGPFEWDPPEDID